MKTKKENSKNFRKNNDGTDLRRLPLLWHSFTELLIFLLPIISAAKFKSKIRMQLSSLLPSNLRKRPPPTSATCAACGSPPVLPCLPSCGHTLCYYCLSSHLHSQVTMACP